MGNGLVMRWVNLVSEGKTKMAKNPKKMENAEVSGGASVSVEEKSVRSFSMTAQQVYERFEKLPLPQRKTVATWAASCSAEASLLLLMPKGSDSSGGRPEKWRVHSVDTQRWNAFEWRPLLYKVVNSTYESPEQLHAAGMAVLDSLAFPLVVLANRYEKCSQVVVVEVPVRFGLAMPFIRAQAKANAQQVAAGMEGSDSSEEKEARDAWIAEGLTMDSYRSFALQLFQLRQECDPPFVLMVFRQTPLKLAVVWFRDVHLATGVFYKGLMPNSIEHLYWPNFDHKADADPPLSICERAGCGQCGGLVNDERLQSTFVKHTGPWKKAGKDLLQQEMRNQWNTKYNLRIDAAQKEMAEKLPEEELKTRLAQMETQLREQLQDQEAEIAKRVEAARVKAFKKCGRCRLVWYCGADCQKKDWPSHSPYCVERKEKDSE